MTLEQKATVRHDAARTSNDHLMRRRDADLRSSSSSYGGGRRTGGVSESVDSRNAQRLDEAIVHLRAAGHATTDEDLQRVSPPRRTLTTHVVRSGPRR
jgi:hypothetical protein